MSFSQSKYNYFYQINSKYTLLNNTLTGAVDIIENKAWNQLLKNNIKNIKPNLTLKLVDRGYLYNNIKNEDLIFKKLYNNYLKIATKKPVRFVFCPTYTCNLKCVYCFEKNLNKNLHKFMDENMLDHAIRAANKISKIYNGKINSIELYGGEPLLKKAKFLIKKILEFGEKNKSKITIITNGINAIDFIDIFKPLKNQIDMMQITIDGIAEIHDTRRKFHSGKGSFNKIVKSIDALLKNDINTNIRVNIDNKNIAYLPLLYKYVYFKKWLEYNNFKIKLSLVTNHSIRNYNKTIIPEEILLEKLIRIYNDYPELEELFGYHIFKPLRHLIDILDGAPNSSPSFFNCESNIIDLNIFCPDGYIYVCPESIGNKNVAIGKFYTNLIFSENKKNIWRNRSILNMNKCRSCKFAPICGGGCGYSSILIYKKYNEPICERYQEVIDTYLKLRGDKIIKKFVKS
jgi:uncharacterized protein